ncbi:unnamed protein product, partial [Prunus brigantina]
MVEFELYSSFTVLFFYNWIIPSPVLFQTKQAKKGNSSEGSFTVSRAENVCLILSVYCYEFRMIQSECPLHLQLLSSNQTIFVISHIYLD